MGKSIRIIITEIGPEDDWRQCHGMPPGLIGIKVPIGKGVDIKHVHPTRMRGWHRLMMVPDPLCWAMLMGNNDMSEWDKPLKFAQVKYKVIGKGE